MTTKWTKNAKEGFVEALPESTIHAETKKEPEKTTPEVAEYGDDVYIGKDPNETILMNTSLPTENPKATPTATPSTIDKVKDLQQNFDQTKAKELYNSMVSSAAQTVANSHKTAAKSVIINAGIHKQDEIDSEAAKNDLKILSEQVLRWGTIVTSYIVVLNLWYILCYTNFTFDFRDWIFSPLHYIFAPTLNAVEAVNYHILNFRMDSNPKLFGKFPITNEQIRDLWNWRPVMFTLLHFIIAGALVGFSFLSEAAGIFSASGSGSLYFIMLALSIYYFFNLGFVVEKWVQHDLYKLPMIGSLLFLGIMLISGLSVPVVISFFCIIFLTYITFLSNFGILLFNGFNPFASWRIVNEIFNDLRGAPISNENPLDFWGKLKNLAFRNFHGFYLFFIVFGLVFSVNMVQCSKFSSSKLILIAVVTNIVACAFFAPSIITLFTEFLTLIFSSNPAPKVVVPSES